MSSLCVVGQHVARFCDYAKWASEGSVCLDNWVKLRMEQARFPRLGEHLTKYPEDVRYFSKTSDTKKEDAPEVIREFVGNDAIAKIVEFGERALTADHIREITSDMKPSIKEAPATEPTV